jgi:DNA-binding response OmpR family regulator
VNSPLIYVIDDDPVFGQLVQIIIKKKFQLQVKSFRSINSAWEFMGEEVPDIVILDYHLPDFKGDEWMIRLSEACHLDQCSVLLITGSVLGEKEKFGIYSLGITEIFTKPLREEFLECLQEILDERDAELK